MSATHIGDKFRRVSFSALILRQLRVLLLQLKDINFASGLLSGLTDPIIHRMHGRKNLQTLLTADTDS